MYLDSHVHACASVSVFNVNVHLYGAFLVAQTDSKESASNAGDASSIPELGRTPGAGNGNPLQYFCLENSMEPGLQMRLFLETKTIIIIVYLSLSPNAMFKDQNKRQNTYLEISYTFEHWNKAKLIYICIYVSVYTFPSLHVSQLNILYSYIK